MTRADFDGFLAFLEVVKRKIYQLCLPFFIVKKSKMYDIITLGSADVDVFVKTQERPEILKHLKHRDIAYHLGEKLLVSDLSITTGGGGTNTAVAFSRLRLKTGFIGVVGDDMHGNRILNELKKERVDFLGTVKEGNTGMSIILPGKNDRTILTYKGLNDRLLMSDIKLHKLKTKWIYVSSMLGQSLETAEKVIHMVKKSGTKVALNISGYLASKGLNYLSSILGSADVIVLNNNEAEILTGKHKLNDIFEEMYKYTHAIIAITSGPGNVYASDGFRIYVKKVHPVNPVDSTGAGDAFASGFTYSLMRNPSVHHALECGYREAFSVLMYMGAKNNLLRKL